MDRFFKYFFVITFFAFSLTACNDKKPSTYYGYVEANLNYLSSPYGGKLETLSVNRGDPIKSGQLLFTLEAKPELFEANQVLSSIHHAKAILKDLQTGKRPSEIQAIEAQITQVSKEVDFYQKEYQRHQKLMKSGTISLQKYDEIFKNYLTAKARLQSLEAELVTAKLPAREEQINAARAILNQDKSAFEKTNWVIAQKTHHAAIDGSIFDTYYQVGEYVPPGRPIVSVLAPKDVKVVFYIPEPMLSQIKINQPIQIRCDGCLNNTIAHIRFISPMAEYTPPFIYSQKNRQKFVYRVEAQFKENLNKTLLPGQPVDITMMTEKLA